MAGHVRSWTAATVLLLLAARAQGGEDEAALAGMDAVARSDWVAAAEAFAKSSDTRSRLRLATVRKLAAARLVPLVDQLLRDKRWPQLAEVAALGLAIDPHHHRFKGAAKRVEREGVAALPPVDGRIRPWLAHGAAWGDAVPLLEGCLAWLEKRQEPEGHWDSDKHGGGALYDPGVTALALRALLPYRPDAARRAADALLRMREDEGHFGTTRTHSWMYNHALATEALADYARVAGKVDDCRAALAQAAQILVDAQNPGAGWRYEPRGRESDTSVTARAAAALHAVERAGVLRVDEAVWRGTRAWVSSMTDPNFGQVGYNFPGGVPARPEGKHDRFPPEHTQAMSASGAVAQLLAGADPFQVPAASLALVTTMPPKPKYPDLYYWEAATRAGVLQCGALQDWWYAELVKAAASCRDDDGGIKPCDVWSDDGGRVWATAACALALSAPSREEPVPAYRALREGQRTVAVAAAGWVTPTGVYVESGMNLLIEAKGAITACDGPTYTPEGGAPRGSGKARERSAPFGCLLGAIDDGTPFQIAPGKKNTMRGYGHLWLMVNDDNPYDNYGTWTVTIEISR